MGESERGSMEAGKTSHRRVNPQGSLGRCQTIGRKAISPLPNPPPSRGRVRVGVIDGISQLPPWGEKIKEGRGGRFLTARPRFPALKFRCLMHGIKELIEEAESLPVEERILVIDSLLRTLNPPTAEIDADWARVARRRLKEIRSGQVKAIPPSSFLRKPGTAVGE